jgi:hypothetical protein
LVVSGFHRLYNRHSHLDQFKWAFNNYIGILHQCGYLRAWVLKTLRITLKKSSLNKKERDVDYHLIMDFQPKIHLLTFFSIMEQFNSNRAIGIHQHPNIYHWSQKTKNRVENAPTAQKDEPTLPILPINHSIQLTSKRQLPLVKIFLKFQ